MQHASCLCRMGISGPQLASASTRLGIDELRVFSKNLPEISPAQKIITKTRTKKGDLDLSTEKAQNLWITCG